MDRKLLWGASLLLVIEIIVLMADVDLIRLPGLSFNTSAPKSKELGRLTYRRSMVRKKSVDSLVWQETQNQDALYQHDRVLTLDQSEAQLELADDVKIHLYENTLVVIEPPEDNKEDGKKEKTVECWTRS